MNTAIVIPAHNEAATIADVVHSVAAFGTPLVVDDGSDDDTAELARSAGAVVVRHARNAGYDAALQSGFVEAARRGAELVVTFDADGQHGAAALEEVLLLLKRGDCDLVLGVRERSARVAESLFSAYTRWRFGVNDILCGLKGYRMVLFHDYGRFDATRSVGTELALHALRTKVRFALVDVPIAPRLAGEARFGTRIRGNARILRALYLALRADLGLGLPPTQTARENPHGGDRV